MSTSYSVCHSKDKVEVKDRGLKGKNRKNNKEFVER
jgi:hypothetical protein